MAEHFANIVQFIVGYSERKLRTIKTLRGVARSWAAALQVPEFLLDVVKSSPAEVMTVLQSPRSIYDVLFTVNCDTIKFEILHTMDHAFSPRLGKINGCISSMMVANAGTPLITYDVADSLVEDVKDLFPRGAPFFKKIHEQTTNHTIESLMTSAVKGTFIIDGVTMDLDYNNIRITIGGVFHDVNGVVAPGWIPQPDTMYVIKATEYWRTTSRAAAMWLSNHMESQVFAHIWM